MRVMGLRVFREEGLVDFRVLGGILGGFGVLDVRV